MKLHEWNKVITSAYNDYMKGIDPQDTNACNARMKSIRDDLQALAQGDMSSQIPPAARMRSALQQFTVLVSMVQIVIFCGIMTDGHVSGRVSQHVPGH